MADAVRPLTGNFWMGQAGGRLVATGLESRSDLADALQSAPGSNWRPQRLDCDLLVNCTGLHGATQLFGDDSVYPIRGQVLPWFVRLAPML